MCPGVWTARSPPAGEVGVLAVLEQPVGDGHARRSGRSFSAVPDVGGRLVGVGAERDQEGDLGGDRRGRVAVRRGADDGGVGGVHGDPGARGLPHPLGQAEVVEVQVGDQHAADVGDARRRSTASPAVSAAQPSSLSQPVSSRPRPPPSRAKA